MADLFSRSFHCVLVPSWNLPPKPSERIRISSQIPLPKRWVRVTHHSHMLVNSTSPSSSTSNSDAEDFDIISSTECSDGSVLFQFGNASEIREKMAALDQEKTGLEGVQEEGKVGIRVLLREDVENLNTVDDHASEEELGTSTVVVVGVADQNLQLPVNEKKSVVLDNDSEVTLINDTQEIDTHLMLDSVDDDLHVTLSEDVAADEGNDVLSVVSEEDSEIDSQEGVVIIVSTDTPESDVFSDLNNSGATGEDEEKEEADKGLGLDRATNSELVPVSPSLESEQVADDEETAHDIVDADKATNNLTGGVDADLSELMQGTNSLECENIAHDEETTAPVVEDSNDTSKMDKSAMLHDSVPPSDLENKLDVSIDDENKSHPTVPEIHSVETASDGEETSRAELFINSGAAYLPHPSKMVNKPTNDNFQALTSREDAYFISHQNWLGVADGVGQWSLEENYAGSNTGQYVRELKEKCESILSNCENISTIKPAEVLIRTAAETQTPGSSAVLVAHFDGQAFHAANVGNTGFIIIRDGSILKKSSPMFLEFNFPVQIVNGEDPSEIIQEYNIDLNDGDVIITATNGLFDNLYEQEIASIISKSLQAGLKPKEIAQVLVMRAQEVGRSSCTRSPFADAAQAEGYVGYTGGKLDDVTIIVSLVSSN